MKAMTSRRVVFHVNHCCRELDLRVEIASYLAGMTIKELGRMCMYFHCSVNEIEERYRNVVARSWSKKNVKAVSKPRLELFKAGLEEIE